MCISKVQTKVDCSKQKKTTKKTTKKQCSTTCKKPATVAANQFGYLTGDPHLRGGDGELYDVHGQAGNIYSVLKDKNLDYNAKYGSINNMSNNGVVESGITLKGSKSTSKISFNKDGKAVLSTITNGKTTETPIEKGKTYKLADGGTVAFGQAYGGGADGQSMEERLITTTGEGYIITQVARQWGYIDSNVQTPKAGVNTDKVLPTGLLGDTFDADSKARVAKDNMGTGVLNNALSSYTKLSLFA